MDDTYSDDTLAEMAIHNADAFAMLYRRYLQRVYSYLLSQVGNVQDAQDLTTQTFIAALNSLHTYKARGMFGAWVVSIARHKAMDHFRNMPAVISIDDAPPILDHGQAIDDLVLERMEMQQIVSLLDKINPERAEALRLRFFGELKMREIAEVMDKSEGAVKMLIARALDDIRHMIEKQEEHS